MNKSLLCLAAAVLAAATPAFAAPRAKGVVRPGDMTMSCEAMAEEINQLDEAKAKRARSKESGRKFAGFAAGALGAAAPSLMARATGDQALAAQTVMGAVQGAQSQDGGAAEEAAPAEDTSVEARRLNRLNGLFAERGC